jgi:hypothetical protein
MANPKPSGCVPWCGPSVSAPSVPRRVSLGGEYGGVGVEAGASRVGVMACLMTITRRGETESAENYPSSEGWTETAP